MCGEAAVPGWDLSSDTFYRKIFESVQAVPVDQDQGAFFQRFLVAVLHGDSAAPCPGIDAAKRLRRQTGLDVRDFAGKIAECGAAGMRGIWDLGVMEDPR